MNTRAMLKRGMDTHNSSEAKRSTLSNGNETSIARDFDSFSPIELLPKELVWIIIDYVPESVLDIRATSRTLKSVVDEYAVEPPRIPVVKNIVIQTITDKMKTILIEIFINSKKAKLFALSRKLKEPDPSSKILKRGRIRSCVRYDARLIEATSNTNGIEFLRGCIGKSIGVGVTICDTSLGKLDALFEGIRFAILEISNQNSPFTDDTVKHLHTTISDHKIKIIKLTVCDVTLSDPVVFLLNLSTQIRSIEIVQANNAKIDRNAAYLFGLHNADWGKIVVEMFSRKVDKMKLVNYWYENHISVLAADYIKASLPSLGKEVWFFALCKWSDENLDYTVNDHNINVYGRRLDIKHISRLKEHFNDILN